MFKYIKEMCNIFKQTSFEGLIRYIAFKKAINLNFSPINRKSNPVKLILLGSGTYAAYYQIILFQNRMYLQIIFLMRGV